MSDDMVTSPPICRKICSDDSRTNCALLSDDIIDIIGRLENFKLSSLLKTVLGCLNWIIFLNALQF